MTTSKKWLCIKNFANFSSSKTYKSIITSLPIKNSGIEIIIDDNGCHNYVDLRSLLEYFRQIPRNKRWKRNKNEDKIKRSP